MPAPHTDSTEEGAKSYPHIYDEGSEDQPNWHPALLAIKNGAKITGVEIDGVWEDDHCPCVGVTAKLSDGKEYKWSEWWTDYPEIILYARAGISNQHRTELTNNIKSWADAHTY